MRHAEVAAQVLLRVAPALLAEFGGQDTSYAETVNPGTGAHRPVVRPAEDGFVGSDLTADGSTILGAFADTRRVKKPLLAVFVALGAGVHAVEPGRISLEERLLDILRAGQGGDR